MTRRGKFTGAYVDEFKIVSAFEQIDEALRLMPPRTQLCEWPKLQDAVDLLDNAMIDLSQCGVDVHPRPTDGEAS